MVPLGEFDFSLFWAYGLYMFVAKFASNLHGSGQTLAGVESKNGIATFNSTIKSTTSQILTIRLFASRIGSSGCIACIIDYIDFGRTLLRMKLEPVPVLQKDTNRAVDRRPNPMFAAIL